MKLIILTCSIGKHYFISSLGVQKCKGNNNNNKSKHKQNAVPFYLFAILAHFVFYLVPLIKKKRASNLILIHFNRVNILLFIIGIFNSGHFLSDYVFSMGKNGNNHCFVLNKIISRNAEKDLYPNLNIYVMSLCNE